MTFDWRAYRTEQLVPHSSPMVLIDEIIDAGDDYIVSRITITENSMLLNESGEVPAWVGIEYMAQTISAFAGLEAKRTGEPIKLGFLLGTRRYETSLEAFPKGMVLDVRAQSAYSDASGLDSFYCSLSAENETVATARLNVYQPQDVDSFFAGKKL